MSVILKSYSEIESILKENNSKKPFLCCGKSFEETDIFKYLKQFSIVVFDNIRPNPRFEDMVTAAELFKAEDCDFMLAAGGGSPMDSAKMIRILINNDEQTALYGTIENNSVKALFIPTTAGTGSEATKTSVFYLNEVDKYSVHSLDFIPDYILFDERLLETLPLYQRKCTCLDALCHALESYMSKKANDESREYAKRAIELFLASRESYLKNEAKGNKTMLEASFYAGKAINITGTVSAHAMCYSITMNCGTAHGHSVAACLDKIWEYMLDMDYPKDVFVSLAEILGGKTAEDGYMIFKDIYYSMGLEKPCIGKDRIEEFVEKVNPSKLSTNPVTLGSDDVREIYKRILL